MDVGTTVAKLAELGVRVHCLALGGVDLTSSTGKLTRNVLNAVAEFERDLLIERTRAGLSRAKAEGKTLGRPSSLTEDQRREIEHRFREGGHGLGTGARVQHQPSDDHARTGRNACTLMRSRHRRAALVFGAGSVLRRV